MDYVTGDMRKVLNWIAKLFIAVLLVVSAGLIYFIISLWNTQEWDEVLKQIPILIALIATIAALLSLWVARDSLELSRVTTRPFLNIKVVFLGHGGINKVTISIKVENTGNLPAEKTTMSFSWHIGEKEHSLNRVKPIQSIIFPGETAESTYLVEKEEDVNSLYGSQIKVEVNYQYKYIEYFTKRTFNIDRGLTENLLNWYRSIPIPEKDDYK